MVYKGVIFIHFPWLKIAAGWHRIIIPLRLFWCLRSIPWPVQPVVPRWFGALTLQMRHSRHSLFDLFDVIYLLIPCFHCLYPTLSPQWKSIILWSSLGLCRVLSIYINWLVSTIIQQNMPPRTPFLRSQGTSTNSMGGFPAMKLMTQGGISHDDYILISHYWYITIAISIGISHISIGISHYIYI